MSDPTPAYQRLVAAAHAASEAAHLAAMRAVGDVYWLMQDWLERDDRRDGAAEVIALLPAPLNTAPATEDTVSLPGVGDRYVSRTDPTRVVTVTRVWSADDGHAAVAYEWRDSTPGQHGSACPIEVFNRQYEALPADPAVGFNPTGRPRRSSAGTRRRKARQDDGESP